MNRKLSWHGQIKECDVTLTRKSLDDDWYEIIIDHQGFVIADGWIKESAGWPVDEARQHALELCMFDPAPLDL